MVIDAKLDSVLNHLKQEADVFRIGAQSWNVKGNLNGELNAHSLRDHNREKVSIMLASNIALLTATTGAGGLASVVASTAGQSAMISQG